MNLFEALFNGARLSNGDKWLVLSDFGNGEIGYLVLQKKNVC